MTTVFFRSPAAVEAPVRAPAAMSVVLPALATVPVLLRLVPLRVLLVRLAPLERGGQEASTIRRGRLPYVLLTTKGAQRFRMRSQRAAWEGFAGRPFTT